MKRALLRWLIFGVATLCVNQVIAGEKKHTDSKLHVVVDDAGQIVLSWNGKEELAEARGKNGNFKRIPKSTSPYVVAPTEEVASYRLESSNGNVYSVNAVGENIDNGGVEPCFEQRKNDADAVFLGARVDRVPEHDVADRKPALLHE